MCRDCCALPRAEVGCAEDEFAVRDLPDRAATLPDCCMFGLVLASRTVKERKIANLTRDNYGQFKS
jgi:hypothetical protein